MLNETEKLKEEKLKEEKELKEQELKEKEKEFKEEEEEKEFKEEEEEEKEFKEEEEKDLQEQVEESENGKGAVIKSYDDPENIDHNPEKTEKLNTDIPNNPPFYIDDEDERYKQIKILVNFCKDNIKQILGYIYFFESPQYHFLVNIYYLTTLLYIPFQKYFLQ